jgi:hypothetical protein
VSCIAPELVERPVEALARLLYSQPKQARFQRSAQPSPPAILLAPLVGRLRLAQQLAEVVEVRLRRRRSLRTAASHLAMNCSGVTRSRTTDFHSLISMYPPSIKPLVEKTAQAPTAERVS